jgi:hypothetical protein
MAYVSKILPAYISIILFEVNLEYKYAFVEIKLL